MQAQDTIVALATGRPPAAIAIIRISGPLAHSAARELAGELPPDRSASRRRLRSDAGELIDEALVLRFSAPASSTGEDVVEFHCHGGRAVVDAVLNELTGRNGVRLALPGEFTRRAFENGRIDLTEAEGLADLLEAETESQRRAALALAGGGLRSQIAIWQNEALRLSARAEAAIDYDEEDDTGTDHGLSDGAIRLAQELSSWLARPRIEPLRDGAKVVLAGPPNSGKSSLINAMVGAEKAIVTELPGTTRDRIEVPISLGGVPVVLVDTAGMRETPDSVERLGVERAEAAARGADVLLWLGHPSDAPEHPTRVMVHSRSDMRGRGPAPSGSLAVSGATGEGVAELLARIAEEVGHLLPHEGEVALNRRQANALEAAEGALRRVAGAADVVVQAEELRSARCAFDHITGRAGIEDMLDNLFGRFCLGK